MIKKFLFILFLSFFVVFGLVYANPIVSDYIKRPVLKQNNKVDDRQSLKDESIEALVLPTRKIKYNSSYKAFYDSQDNRVYPISYQDTTYLPLRAISALLNIKIDWKSNEPFTIRLGSGALSSNSCKDAIEVDDNESSYMVTALKNTRIRLYCDNKITILENNVGDVIFPISYNDTTYLPLRALCNLFDLTIDYDTQTDTCLISNGENNDYVETNLYDFRAISTNDPDFYDKEYNKLPIGLESVNLAYPNSIKLGYDVSFAIKEQGMDGQNLNLKVSFSYLDKSKDSVPEEVELFYLNNKKEYVPIVSNSNSGDFIIKYALVDQIVHCPATELSNTMKFYEENNMTLYNYAFKNKYILKNREMIIPNKNRLLTEDGNFDWYFVFGLPASTVAIRSSDITKMGYTDISKENSNEIVKLAIEQDFICQSGYISVNMDIELIDDSGAIHTYNWNEVNSIKKAIIANKLINIPFNSVVIYESNIQKSKDLVSVRPY